MKIGAKTLEVLNNFSSIYQSIIIRPGNVIRTATPTLDIFASATVDDSFERTVGIYNLKKFLGVLSLFKGSDPDVVFTDTHATITAGRRKIEYVLSDQAQIKAAPDKDPNVPEPTATFSLSSEELDNAVKALSVLELNELVFEVDGKEVLLKAADQSNVSKDKYTIKLAELDVEAKVSVRVPKQTVTRLLDRDYSVGIHEKYLKLESPTVTYWIPALAE